ncbi:MAG: hypothetical protein E7493_01750 [Ruminococcus albus]|nr:hypothetical protein [Ruminococcus albus]
MLYGKEINEIRKLRKNNRYNFRLRMIEYQFAQGHISREQELDKAVKLVLDYIGEKVKSPDTLKILSESEMYAGIDTIQIKTDKEIEEEVIKQKDYVHNNKRKCLKDGRWLYVVNPDKFNDNIGIYKKSEYTKVFDEMMFNLELTARELSLSRVDFRFDFFDDNTFNKLWKLNNVLIALLSQKYNIKNRYASTDIISCERLTLRAQTQYFQIEYYHKRKQEPNGNVDTRLELRSCKMANNTDERKEFEKWKTKLLKILDSDLYKTLQEEKNNRLYERWKKEKTTYKNMSVYEFLSKYIDHFYTQEQLSDFFKWLGYKAPNTAASDYKRKKGFEPISMKLLMEYVNKIISSGERFFDS